MHLETDRLILRPLELEDAPVIQELVSARAIAETTLNIPHPYPAGAAETIIRQSNERREQGAAYTFGIIRTADSTFLGCVGLQVHQEYERAEMGYWIGVPYWNQGYTTEAVRRIIDFGFSYLSLNRIYATYFTGNVASRRVMEKAGMVYEATLPQHVRRFDRFHDLGYCGILRAMWLPR